MLSYILLTFTLSIDTFFTAAAYSLKSTKIPFLSKIIITTTSIVLFGGSVLLGERISSLFQPAIAKMIGIILMSVICIWMLLQVLLNKNDKLKNIKESQTIFRLILRPLGITIQVIRNPMLGDIDNSRSINGLEALFLCLALSIDSICVGFGYTMIDTMDIWVPLLVGFFQLAFLYLGEFAGKFFVRIKNINTNYLQLISVTVMFILLILRVFT